MALALSTNQSGFIVVTTRETFKIVSSPVIPFKNEMAMELLEKGRVRFWTQVEKCTSACQVDYVFNDVILSQGQVGIVLKNKMSLIFILSIVSTSYDSWIGVSCFQKYTVNFDESTGIIEMFMDSLEVTDEGTFTFNLVDGKAKGTTSLVLIGDGKIYMHICYILHTDLSVCSP